MKPTRPLVIVCALTTATTAPAAARAQESPLSRAIHDTVLGNGLEVLAIENHVVPVATVLVAVRNGAFTQQRGEQGLAHLYEHLLFRTYDRDPSAFSQEVAGMSGAYNGSTHEEVVTYYVIVPSENTEDAIELLGRLLTRARFRDDDLVEERRVVLDEIFRARSDPEQALERQVGQQLWGDAWHLRDIGGDSLSLNAITLDQLEAHFERYYIPNNSAVIVTGDISPAEVFREVERRFGDWDRGADPVVDRASQAFVPLAGSRAVVVGESNVQDVTVSIALNGPSLHDDTASTYAADALLAVLNEPSSRFQQYLVGSGLFQWVDANYLTLREPSAITFRAKTTMALAEHAVTALVSALDQALFLLDLTPQDLAIAQKARELDMALTLEATAGLAPSLAVWWASAGIDYYLTYDARLNAQTLQDLRQFADRYVLGRPKVIGILAPPEARNRIASWLQGSPGSRP